MSELTESGYFETQLQYVLATAIFVWDVLAFQQQNVLYNYDIISYLLNFYQFVQVEILTRIWYINLYNS